MTVYRFVVDLKYKHARTRTQSFRLDTHKFRLDTLIQYVNSICQFIINRKIINSYED